MYRPMTSRRKNSNATNITETESGYQLVMTVPGYRREEITIKVEDQKLSITASKPQTETASKINYQEWQLTPIHKTWTLGKGIDTSSVNAKLDNGILTIDLAKKPEAKPKTIEIA